MKRTAVINVVGLTDALLGAHTPRLAEFRRQGALSFIKPAFPAVTCTAQSTYLTGMTPTQHGIVGNGWYHRELAEVQFWKQSNHLVSGRKLWEELREREPRFTVAKLFWWYNMYSSADYSITPRPIYPADGRKLFDIYSWPYSIREELKRDLGAFPFATFWGPAAGNKSPQGGADAASRWIAAAAKWIEHKCAPMLHLIYLPHLDYNLQRFGPFQDTPSAAPAAEAAVPRRMINPAIIPDLQAVDAIVGDLIEFFQAREIAVIVLSEYGINNVDQPVHLNRIFREAGWLTLKEELGRELLDCGASQAFAVADHQVAHIYLKDRSLEARVRALLEPLDAVETVLGAKEKAALGIDHSRAGDLIAVARDRAWFTYYYWREEPRAPDFARTVDIHRKPGYDPVELFLDPRLPLPRARIAWRLLKKKLGFRMLMDVIPTDASLVRGSHGRCPEAECDWPVLISERKELVHSQRIEATDVYHSILRHVGR